jgi:alpha-tubulin suppressor-like RCC1 family protein
VTCYVGIGGGVKCWGKGSSGQLGNNTKTAIQKTPVDVTGLTSGVRTVSVGRYQTCAVTTTGGVKCWGSNASGQLGVAATVTESLVPVDVTGLASGYDRVSAGHVFSCALSVTGGVKCWGAGSSGSLGNGLTAQSNTPVDVTGLTSGVAAIATGYSHACALTATGGVKCWGGGSTYTTAVDVPGLTTGVVAIATGQSTGCAALTDGTVKCWGTTRPYAPAAVAGVAGAVAVTADYTHTCARLTGGGAKCWGGNGYGQLGAPGSPTGPVDVAGLTSAVAEVTAGDWHTCAVTTTGVVKCWGWNAEGQLGPGSAATQSDVPIDVTGL